LIIFIKFYKCNQIKYDAMDETCSTNGRDKKPDKKRPP
jgi:hypothetical protein